jgi:hypothetical protein
LYSHIDIKRIASTVAKEKLPDSFLLSISMVLFIVFYLFNGVDFYGSFSYAYTIFTFLRFLNNLGYTINFLDYLAFYSALQTLLTSYLGYAYFGDTYRLSRIWNAQMRVPEETYFAFMIPANLAFFAGLQFFFKKNVNFAREYMQRAREHALGKTNVGIWFIVTGLICGQLKRFMPEALTFVFALLAVLVYVGGFYLYFSVKKRRGLVLAIVFLVLFLQAAISALFGEFVLFVVLAGCLIMSQYQFSFLSKLSVFIFLFSAILVIQSSKLEYRNIVWYAQRESKAQYKDKGNLEIFSELIGNKLSDPSQIISKEGLFYLNRRFNQGWLISMAMNYVPRVEPFAYGETIGLSLAAVVVPRFLWPDKPEAGGHLNLARFLGIKEQLNYSMNIGPFGEAYGNFGVAGGVLFVLFYGLLLAWFLHKTLEKAKKYPSLIIWMPLLFYYVVTVETDILTTINSFVKSVVFVLLVYYFCKIAFKTEI